MLFYIALRYSKGLVSEGLGANGFSYDYIGEGKGKKLYFLMQPAIRLRTETCYIFTFLKPAI